MSLTVDRNIHPWIHWYATNEGMLLEITDSFMERMKSNKLDENAKCSTLARLLLQQKRMTQTNMSKDFASLMLGWFPSGFLLVCLALCHSCSTKKAWNMAAHKNFVSITLPLPQWIVVSKDTTHRVAAAAQGRSMTLPLCQFLYDLATNSVQKTKHLLNAGVNILARYGAKNFREGAPMP